MKIVDKLNTAVKEGRTFYSFEFFPPRTEEGVENLFDRMDRLASYGPLFCDITWGAGGSTADLTLDIANKMQNTVCVETMMHLTCTNITQAQLDDALDKVKEYGIQNILALRGDPPKDQTEFTKVEGGYEYALDLVKHIRAQYGDYFGITVAGYPEAHPDNIVDDPEKMSENYWKEIENLKAKIDAGGDMVVTQLFYDVDAFLKFVTDCRSVGIEAPIIPGIMPIMTYGGFKRMTGFCKTKVPQSILDTLEGVKDNDEAVKNFGIALGTDMCKKILDAKIPGIHMYTLNLERSAVAILENVGLITKTNVSRTLPWRPATNVKRTEEAIRPIFWSNRPKAYLNRTADWDSYPSGRWGNAKSPAYGTLSDYQFMRRHTSSEKRQEKARAAWGKNLDSLDSIIKVFVKYLNGEIDVLPWSEMEALHGEAHEIRPQLVQLCKHGYLTINSQPQVNGLPSTDPNVGWGGPGGFVYQKAYVEFFTSPERFESLAKKIEDYPTITYLAVNRQGHFSSNLGPEDVNAVTWGVFPGKEISQPTVVDPESFLVWKDEAFQLWKTEWASLYDEGSPSRQLIQGLMDNWYLVSVVENNHISGNLFAPFGL